MPTENNKILVTIMDDPLRPDENRRAVYDWDMTTIQAVINQTFPLIDPETEICAVVNGRIFSPEEYGALLAPGDSVGLWAAVGDKQTLRTVALIGLTFATALVAPWLAGGLGLGVLGTKIATAVIGMGMAAMGGLLINTLLPLPVAEERPDASPNYGWNPRSNTAQEGAALPSLYGSVRFAPPLIAHHLELDPDGQRQFYNGLYALNGAELAGLSKVLLNGEDYTNFDAVDLDFRSGTDDQTVIDWFNDTWALTGVNALLDAGADETPTAVNQPVTTGDWVEIATTESDVTEFSLNFVFAAMIGILLIEGGEYFSDIYGPETASFRIQWTDYADSGWASPTTEDWTFTGGGGLAGPAKYATFTKDNLSSGRWRIRVKLNSALNNSNTVDLYDMRETAPIDPTLRTTSGNTVERLQVGLLLPGLAYANDNGGLDPQTVKVRVEYREVGGSGGWSGENIDITEATTGTVRRVVDFKHLRAGADQYQVRVYYREAPNAGDRYYTDVYFDYLQEAVKDDFRYPGVALLAVRALATDQLENTFPKIEVIADRGDCESGKPSNNPAWAARDILLKAGLTTDQLVESDFTAWATFCASNSLEVNIYLDQVMSLPDALRHVGIAGQGTVVQKGSQFGVLIDQAGDSSLLFTDANVVAGSFQEEFLPGADMANSLEVTHWDEDLDWTRQVFELRVAGVDSGDLEVKKSAFTLRGVTNRAQAVDLATIVLNHIINLHRVISFEAAVDAITVQPGDIFTYSAALTNWGQNGRVVSSTGTTVTLDQEVTLVDDGTGYTVLVRHQDTDALEVRSVVVPGGGATTDALTVSLAWDNNPAADAVYLFGTVSASEGKDFRVISIEHTQDQFHRITAGEYFDADYSGGVTVSSPQSLITHTRIDNLAATESWHPKPDGSGEARVELTWIGVALKWKVYVQWASNGWQLLGATDDPWYQTGALPEGPQLNFTVVADGDSWDNGDTANVTLAGKPVGPAVPSNVSLTEVQGGIRINWTAPTDKDFAYVGIWRDTSDSFPGGDPIYTVASAPNEAGAFTDRAVSYDQTYYYWLKAFNHSDIASDVTASVNGSPTRTATDDIADDAVDNTKLDTGDEYNIGASGEAYMSGSDPTWRFWAGHATAASAPYRVDKDGNLYATSATIAGTITATAGTIGGFTVNATEGLYAGGGTTRVQMKPGAGFWAGATSQGSAPFSVTQAGVLTATSGTIAAFTISPTAGLYAGTGATRVQMKPGAGFWAGATTIGAAPFSVTQAGVLTATSGAIGGWSLSGTKLSATGIDFDSANQRLYVYTADNSVTIDPDGILGIDDVLGTTFKLPTDGSPPEFSSGIIKEVEYQIYTSGVIQTNADVAANGGLLINNTHIVGYNSDPLKLLEFVYQGENEGDAYLGDYDSGNAGLFYDHSEATLYYRGAIIIQSGSGIANLTDAGALATKSSVNLNSGEVTSKSLANLDSAANTKLGGIATGADVTGSNTAAAITGQGALATKSSVDLSSGEVTNKTADNIVETAGKKWAAEAGADVTRYINNADSNGTGWRRVAHIDGSSGRGSQVVSIYTTGGSFTPVLTTVQWMHSWSTLTSLTVLQHASGSYWDQVRITDTGTNSYLEFYFKSDVDTLKIELQRIGNFKGAIYSGILPAGGDTVRQTQTLVGNPDKTSANTAANISGQGALATQSSVDLNTVEVTNKSLANLDSTANTKLGGIATGATVGANWSSDLSNIPATLETPSAAGLYLSDTYMGYYTAVAWTAFIKDDGTIYGGDGSGEYFQYVPGSGVEISTANASAITIKSGGSISLEAGGDLNFGLSDTNPSLLNWGNVHNLGAASLSSRGLCLWPTTANQDQVIFGWNPVSNDYSKYGHIGFHAEGDMLFDVIKSTGAYGSVALGHGGTANGWAELRAGNDAGDEGTKIRVTPTTVEFLSTAGSAPRAGIGLTPTANMTGLALEGGALTIKEITTPTADTNYGKVYTKNDNKLYFQDGAGGEHEVAFV